jgi:hypothetical protein
MAIKQCLRSALFSFSLLKDGELICIDGFVFVNTGLYVPAREVAAVTAGECSGAESPYWKTLPITIVDVAVNSCNARIIKRQAERTLPCSFRDCLA